MTAVTAVTAALKLFCATRQLLLAVHTMHDGVAWSVSVYVQFVMSTDTMHSLAKIDHICQNEINTLLTRTSVTHYHS
jgi:hypothetical protein